MTHDRCIGTEHHTAGYPDPPRFFCRHTTDIVSRELVGEDAFVNIGGFTIEGCY
jgi:hypothetical protein